VNGTCRKLCDADRRVLEGVLRLMRGERYAGEPVWSIRYVTCGNFKVNALPDGEPMKLLKSSSGWYCWIIENNFCQRMLAHWKQIFSLIYFSSSVLYFKVRNNFMCHPV